MAFDIDGAKKAGYSDAEIADYLGKEQRFDVAAARKAGYSDAELIAHLHSPAKRDAAPQAREPTMGDGAAGSQPQGQKAPGTIDLTKRKVLNNPDGSISTESSFSIGTDQGEVLLPSVINGKRVSMRDAIAHYEQTGEHLGIFDSAENADAYAESLHQQQGQRYGGQGRKRVAYVPGMSPDEVTQTESELNAPPPAPAPKPVETGIMAAIKDPEFWGIVGRRALDMGNAAAALIAKPKPSDGQLLPENYGSDLQAQIGANIQSKITGATEFEAERQKAYAQKRIGQASIMPQLIQDYRQNGIPMRENPLLRGYAETLDIPNKNLAQWTDDFLMDWSLYANMSPADRQAVLLQGKKVLAQANADLEDTGKQRDIIQTVQQNSRPDMKQWSAPALIFDAATSIPDLLVAAGGAIAGGPAAGLLAMGASMAPSFYAEGKSNGLDHRSAGTYAALMSAAELAPELPVAEAIARTPQGKAIMRKLVGNLVDTTGGKIAGTAALESLSEMFTEVLEQGIQSGMLDQHLSLKQALENIARAGTVGAMMGAPFGALPGGHQETSPANSQEPGQPPQAESPVPPASPEVPQEPTLNQQVNGGTPVTETQTIQPEVANVQPPVSPEIPASPAQQDTGSQPAERQAPTTIDRRSLADAFTTGEDGTIDAAQAARAVRAQVSAALDAGQVVTQGGGRTRTPVTDAAQVDVKAVLAGLSRIKIGEQVDQTKISSQPKPEGGESNGQEQTQQNAGQGRQASLLEPTLVEKAKAKSKEAVTIQPDEDGFTLVINGERGATYPTIKQAIEEKQHAIETLQQHADKLVEAEKQRAAEINAAAHEAATSPQNNLPEPTAAQIEANNYRLGHIKLHGLEISIENPKGSIRRSKPGALKTWEREMTAHYGYVRGSEGADGDHVDVFVGDNHNSDKAYVIDQVINGKFDEHKVVVGVDSEDAARKLYLSNYQKGWKGLGAITEMPVEQFKSWVKTEDAKKPLAWKAESAKRSIYREKPAKVGESLDINKPLATEGLTGYRYQGPYGPIMAGAKSHEEALNEVNRSLSTGKAELSKLEVWNGKEYVPVSEPAKEVPNKAQVTPSANTVDRPTPTKVYRGTESNNESARLRFSPDGEMGRAIYVTESRPLAASYGGGPTVKEGAGRTVHDLSISKLNKQQYGYIEGGSKIGEKAKFVDSAGKLLLEYEPTAKSGAAERAKIQEIAKANGIAVIVGMPNSVAENQIAVIDASVFEPAERLQKASANTVFTDDAYAKAKALLKSKLGNINTGLDPEVIQAGITAAGYHIEKGARTFAAYSKAMIDDLGEAIRPYLRSWYEAVRWHPAATAFTADMDSAATIDSQPTQADTQPKVTENVPSTNANLERDSGNSGAENAPVAESVQVEGPAEGSEAGRGQVDSARRGHPDDPGIPDGSPAVARELGDQSLHRAHEQDGPAEFPARDTYGERSDSPGIEGVPPETVTTEQVDAFAVDLHEDARKRAEQRKADSIALNGSLENVRATLPYLQPGQQEDVHKTETRFAKPDGYGYLLTNGTGTGKTFSGLGTIKRYARRGKTNILIVVPDVKISADWVNSAKALGLNITPLEDTKDKGRGITITTYANLGQNDELARRNWDLVVSDEAHQLMQSANGDQTLALNALRAITMHPRGEYSRFEMLNREDIDRQKALSDKITVSANLMRNASRETIAGLQAQNAQLQKELNALQDKLKGKLEEVKAEIAAAQGAGRTRMLALTATPFAYEKTIDWAEGYLFDYGKADETGRSYNRGDARDQFFMRHFGYRMRYGKLTEPDAKVDRGLMQRQFNGWLKKNGVLSGRMLDVPHDYDRRFVLVDSAVGNQIDRAIEYIGDQAKAFAENKANKGEENGWSLLDQVLQNELYGKLGHLVRRYLLEAIKAKEVIPHLRQHLAKNRKIVVFHDFKKGGARNPFDFELIAGEQADPRDAKKVAAYNAAVAQFREQFPDLVGDKLLSDLISPIQRFKKEFPNVLLINGDERKSDLLERYRKFQDDETGPIIALVQSDKNKGWSGHDATGKNQRVLFNLGLPTQPTKSIQQEGRIYRIGQVSNAIFRYLNTGTNWERWAFAQTIAERASAAENLGMGEQARALKDAYIAGFEESGDYPAGHEGEGTGGKARDAAANNALTEFDRARAFYFGTQKKDSRTKAQEGSDYFATAEPLGLKMVQWADPRGGEDFLEPSAGHGAIARWASEKLTRTAIEPSNTLGSRLAMVFDGKIVRGDFESHKLVNKYDTIVMNPPFGSGGRTAIDHVEKAARHLREGGRIAALIPTGPAANAKFDKWFYDEGKEKVVNNSSARGLYLVAEIKLPAVTFERAGTKVMTRVVVLEKPIKGTNAPAQTQIDLTSIDSIKDLFDQLEHIEIPPRAKPVEQDQESVNRQAYSDAREQRIAQQQEQVAAGAQLATDTGQEIIEHTTQKGKLLRGVVRKDLTQEQARSIDEWTFKKNGGYFIRAQHLPILNEKFPIQTPLMDLAEDKEAADANAVRRALAQLAGHEVDPIERKSAVLEIGRLRQQLESGKISSAEFAQQIEALHAKMLEVTAAKRMARVGTERVRGPDFIRQKLIEAKRRGDIDAETSDFAEWFILKNPALVDELGISIKTAGPSEKGSAGQYMPVSRIMKLIKGRAKPTTAVHEILHHLERLMPNEMQAAIRKEYWKQLAATREKAVKAKDESLIKYLDDAAKASITQDKTAMDDMRDALLKGKVERENYQFFNPSEFWSVNMTDLLSARYQVRNSIWKRIKQWMKEALQHARAALRLPSDAPMIKILDDLIEGSDGKSTAKFMLHESTLYENGMYRDIRDEQPSFEAPKPGKEVGLSKNFKTDADTFLYNWQDKHIDTKRVVQAIEKLKGQLSDDKDPYMAEELYHQRAAYRTERFLNDELKPLLEAVKAANLSVADLEQYLWARHAKERNETIAERNPELPDGGSGMLTAEAEGYLADLPPAKREKLEALAERVDKMIEGTRNTLVGYGLESQATMDLRKAAWPSYVPLHRADYENESSYGIGQGFSVKGPDSKAALGSTRKVANILAEIALQRERAIVRGEKNRVSAALFGLAKANPNESWWSTERLPRIRFLDKDNHVVSMIDPKWKSRENVVVVRFPNKAGRIVERGVIFNERNPRAMRMAEALKNLDTPAMEGAIGIMAKFSRYIASINTQYNPIFGLRNLQRDIQEGMLNLTNTAINGKQAKIAIYAARATRGIWQDARAKRHGKHPDSGWAKWFEEMEAEGGTTGHRQLFESSADRAEKILDEFKQLDEGYVGKKSLRAIGNWLSDYNLVCESAVRVAAYRTAREAGLTKARSASIAKNLTINFNRKGRNSQQANALYAFFNAKAQGQARFLQTLAGPAGKAIIAGGLLIGIMQATALAMLGFDDNDPPEFVKQQNLIIPFGSEGRYLIWNMPQSMQLLVSLGRIPTEAAIRDTKSAYNAMMSMFSTVADSFNPMGASTPLQTILPTAVDPIGALAENENWNGQPIYQEKFDANDPAPGFTRSKDTASALSKVVARSLNYLSGGSDYVAGKLSPTPDQIDYLLDQALGGPGREFSKAQQTLSSVASGEDLPDYKIPLWGHYFGNANSRSSERARFYDLARRGRDTKAELEGRAGEAAIDKEAAKARFDAYLAEHPEASITMGAIDAANQVSKIRKAKRQAAANGQPQSVLNQYDEQAASIISQTLARDRQFRQEARQ